jgi:hypothetical protein
MLGGKREYDVFSPNESGQRSLCGLHVASRGTYSSRGVSFPRGVYFSRGDHSRDKRRHAN